MSHDLIARLSRAIETPGELSFPERRALVEEMREALNLHDATAPDPLDAPATDAAVKCVDSCGNTAFIRYTQASGWTCTLGNGIPASMSYAGVPHGEETETVIALYRTKTARDVLRIMQARARRARSVELV